MSTNLLSVVINMLVTRGAAAEATVWTESMLALGIQQFKLLLIAPLLVFFIAGCSLRHLAIEKMGDAVADGSTSFAADDDPELIRVAVPFSLKLMESLLAESPQHKGLLLASAKGFTEYAYVFVQQDADQIEEQDIATASRLRERARRLYHRARDYGLSGLEIGRPDFASQLRKNPRLTVATLTPRDVALVYWTGAAWGALIALSKDSPAMLADIPVVEALIDRALELNEAYDRGAIHTFMIGYEMVRLNGAGDPATRARLHFIRAMELTGGDDAAPLLAFAESVCVAKQNRAEFEVLLKQALQIDVNRIPEQRLANLVMQKRARWLLSRTDQLFTD
ncbi:MAG: TRAP transporter TatT component family protein [Burkholderiales bacterium]